MEHNNIKARENEVSNAVQLHTSLSSSKKSPFEKKPLPWMKSFPGTAPRNEKVFPFCEKGEQKICSSVKSTEELQEHSFRSQTKSKKMEARIRRTTKGGRSSCTSAPITPSHSRSGIVHGITLHTKASHNLPSTGSKNLGATRVDFKRFMEQVPPLDLECFPPTPQAAKFQDWSNSISTFASPKGSSTPNNRFGELSKQWSDREISFSKRHLPLAEKIQASKLAAMRNEKFMDACGGGGSIEQLEQYLAEGADVNYQGEDGWAPLHLAASAGNLQIVQLLIDKGAKINQMDFSMRTPLWWACYGGKVKVVELLVQSGADKDAADEGGLFPGDKFHQQRPSESQQGTRHDDAGSDSESVFSVVTTERKKDILDTLTRTEKRYSETSFSLTEKKTKSKRKILCCAIC